MTKFLKEFAEFEYEKMYDEQDGEKKIRRSKYGNMLVRGILQRANTQNANGRIYPLDVLQREVANYKKLIEERRATGELDHADEPTVNLKFVSHVITNIWWEDDVVYGEVEILDGLDTALVSLVDVLKAQFGHWSLPYSRKRMFCPLLASKTRMFSASIARLTCSSIWYSTSSGVRTSSLFCPTVAVSTPRAPSRSNT